MTVPDPGVYEDVPFEEYTRWEAVNNSSLGPLLRSPAHYLHARDNPISQETDAQRFGSFFHLLMENRDVSAHYVRIPGEQFKQGINAKNVKATKAYKDRVAQFKESVGDKICIDEEEWDSGQAMRFQAMNNPVARRLMRGRPELAIVWRDELTGLLCKARLDMLTKHAIADYKTTRDPASEFDRTIAKWHYHRQAAFYLDGASACGLGDLEFWFVVCEKSAPYACLAAPIDDDSVQVGRDEYRKCLRLLNSCERQGFYPGPKNPENWRLPAWALPKQNLTLQVNGQAVTL